MPGIVVGVDGSRHSERALHWAMHEAAIRRTPLTVMSVHPLMRGYFGGTVKFPDDLELARELGDKVEEEVGKALAQAGSPSPETVRVRVESGSIVEELVNASADADMLVVGSRGAGGFARLMQGSVCALVTQHARCPVVVVPHEDRLQ
ncbi:MAG TPA: universal stress protein [Streptosporangiaceae bacterium]|nr:universal stress protein [Streptosporangiaceae bacterium]